MGEDIVKRVDRRLRGHDLKSLEDASGVTAVAKAIRDDDRCANCDHPRRDHSGTYPEIVCVAEGTDPDRYCTCDYFEED